ncbi:Hypothetical_protein [Hexamita inflata]|uniref:Hypothetical_protein n=1 Tax=Hexamita inflata TaxID=28002 RepID=A0ABP1KS80_9EUKA
MQQSLRCNRFTSRASFPDEVTAMANLGMTTLQRSQDVSSGAPESTACGHAVSLQHTPILRIDELHKVGVLSDRRIGLEDRFVLCSRPRDDINHRQLVTVILQSIYMRKVLKYFYQTIVPNKYYTLLKVLTLLRIIYYIYATVYIFHIPHFIYTNSKIHPHYVQPIISKVQSNQQMGRNTLLSSRDGIRDVMCIQNIACTRIKSFYPPNLISIHPPT